MVRASFDSIAPSGLGVSDHKAAVERAQQERDAERYSRIESQSSPLLTPQERLQRWEILHAVRLPANPDHKLVRVIARDTALDVEQVRAEQARRRGDGR